MLATRVGDGYGDPTIRYLEDHRRSVARTAKLFAAMRGAMTDSIIRCWQLKRDVGFWRPSEAVAAAEVDGTPGTSTEPGWAPLIPTPPYSDLVSGGPPEGRPHPRDAHIEGTPTSKGRPHQRRRTAMNTHPRRPCAMPGRLTCAAVSSALPCGTGPTDLGTGATVTDDGRFVFTIEDAGATFVVRGLGVQMRDGDGSLVYIDAGRVVFDALTGEVISATPNPLSQDYAALVCATLGAEPAA